MAIDITTARTEVAKLYIAAFNRVPDASGLAFWVNSYVAGTDTLATMSQKFANSAEYAAAYPSFMTNDEYVSEIYSNVFGRAADTAGQAFWVGHLVAGTITRGGLMQEMVKGAQGADATKLTNQATFGVWAASEGASVAVASAYLASITDTASVTTAQTAVTAAEGITNASNINLTSNADVIFGTAGSDTYTATNSTLSSADKISDIGGSADKLKVSTNADMTIGAFEMTGVEYVEVTADTAGQATFDLSGSQNILEVESLNSTRDVTFNQLTSVANIEVRNATNNANVTVQYQNTVVAGTEDSINLALTGTANTNTNVGTISIEDQSADLLVDIETINVTVSGANTTVTALDAEMTTLNIAGANNLVITNALNGTERTINAETMTGALTLTSTATAANAVTFKGSQGVDTVSFLATTGNHTIFGNAGNDVITLGLGDDTVDLGAGTDTLLIATNGLTVNDTITGGEGADIIRLTGADSISKSEAEKVTAVETFDLRAAGTTLVVTDNLLTTISSGSDRFTVDTLNATGAHTIDLTNVTFSNTNKFQLVAETDLTAGTTGDNIADNEVVIADDATVNAKALLGFGAGATDTLQVIDGATMTSDDLANISGLEVIELKAASAIAQTWNIQLTDAFVRGASAANNDATDGTAAVLSTAAVAAGSLVIDIDNDVPAGSIVNIDTNALTAVLGAGAVTVRNNANVTVNVTGTGAAQVTVVNSLRYTLNADNMTGTVGNDTFIADTLAQVQAADSADGNGGTDTLQLNFSLSNSAQTVLAQLNNTSLTAMDVLTFNGNSAVAFSTLGAIGGITTVNFDDGAYNDVVTAGATAATYNFKDGNNSYTSNLVAGAEVISAGTGVDTMNFATSELGAGDILTLGAGADILNLTDNAAGAIYTLSGTAVLSGVDTVNYKSTTNAGNGLLVRNTDVIQTDGDTTLTVTVDDNNGGANTAAIFNASAVTTGYSVSATMVTTAGAGLATDAADIIGGAGSDTLSLGASGVTGYAIQGNAGADIIDISGAGAGGAMVRYASANDGGNQGVSSGCDVITGFVSGTDEIGILNTGFLATDTAATGVGNMAVKTDAAVNFTTENALVMTQVGTGLSDTDIKDFAQIVANANVLGITAAATQGGFIVANGVTQSALYLYVEQDGTANNVAVSELKLLGIVDSNALGAVATDLQYV